MLIDHQLVRVLVVVQILRIHHDVFCLAKDGCDLFEWNPFRLRQNKVEQNPAQERNADEDQVKMPSNILECGWGGLEVHQIRQRNDGDRQTDPLSADMVGKDLAVPNHTADVDTKAVDGEEEVEGDDTECEASAVLTCGGAGGEGGDHGCFDDEADAAAEDS